MRSNMLDMDNRLRVVQAIHNDNHAAELPGGALFVVYIFCTTQYSNSVPILSEILAKRIPVGYNALRLNPRGVAQTG